jgi:hypothetical protein
MIFQEDGPANGSQPIRSELNTNFIDGWLPSLTIALNFEMTVRL